MVLKWLSQLNQRTNDHAEDYLKPLIHITQDIVFLYGSHFP